jgi:uncharacterized hydrophobic protein (TIGR00271 family)
MKFFSKQFWNKKRTEEKLEKYHEPEPSFFILMFFSSVIATLGLILNSTAVVIGAMMVAPIITPIFGFALNFLTFQGKDMARALFMILLGTVFGVASAVIFTYIGQLLVDTNTAESAEVIARIEPNILHMLVAIASGMMGAYAYFKPDLQERVVGIAISVALIPPIATIGVGLALAQTNIWQGSLLLYLTNLSGITFGSLVMFVLLGFGSDEKSISEK